jgi:hypothetical protein
MRYPPRAWDPEPGVLGLRVYKCDAGKISIETGITYYVALGYGASLKRRRPLERKLPFEFLDFKRGELRYSYLERLFISAYEGKIGESTQVEQHLLSYIIKDDADGHHLYAILVTKIKNLFVPDSLSWR